MSGAKMKPCPNCGHAKPRLVKESVSMHVMCDPCQNLGPQALFKLDREAENALAIERWNKRPVEDALLEALEVAHEALACCYDVTDYPCDGDSPQDHAIIKAKAAIAKAKGIKS